jgi:hypothetical protein
MLKAGIDMGATRTLLGLACAAGLALLSAGCGGEGADNPRGLGGDGGSGAASGAGGAGGAAGLGGNAGTGGTASIGGTPGTGGTGGSSNTGGTGGTGASAGTGGVGGSPATACSGGPLAAPIANCEPIPLPSTGDLREDCVRRINQLRWECQCLPPLQRWTEGEACAAEHAEYDSTQGPHAGFRDDICLPQAWAQNECPSWPSTAQIITGCLQMMWDEGPGEPYSEHGHYINMTNPSYSRVACGFYTSAGRFWSVQNFQ